MKIPLNLSHKDIQRFRDKIQDAPNGCKLFNGKTTDKGYGQFAIRIGRKTKVIKAHRVAYYIAYQQWPPSIYHKCPHKHCVNIQHLTTNKSEAVQKKPGPNK